MEEGEEYRMKKYRAKINGTEYEVEIELVGSAGGWPVPQPMISAAPAPVPRMAAAPAAAPAAVPAAAPAQPAAAPSPAANTADATAGGAEPVKCPLPGTVLCVNVKPGDQIKAGQCLMILVAMNMENEIMASRDCTVVTVDVSQGQAVETGVALCTIR